jgi:transposase
MKSYEALVGLDWADQQHVVCCRDVASGQVHTQTVEQSPEGIQEWVNRLLERHPGGQIAVCLEQKRGAVVHALMRYEAIDLYPVNTLTVGNARKAFRPSGAKDDPHDAGLLLEILERHAHVVKLWQPDTEQTRLLGGLCEDRRKAVDLRTSLCNSLRGKLKEYFPQALKLVGPNLFSEVACAFLMKWPRFEAVAAARPQTVRKFYHAHHIRREPVISPRLELIASSQPLCTDEAVVAAGILWVQTIVGQIRALNRSIEEYDGRIAELFGQHPDAHIFKSFPGAGQQLAPRLVALFGTDRDRYGDAQEVATYAGIAPVKESSGNQTWIHWRWHCPKFPRQSLVEFATKSIGFCPWAKIYYQEQLARGKRHHAAVRALAFKWVRIMFRCWKTRQPYDEATYLAALEKHGSWIPGRLQKAA